MKEIWKKVRWSEDYEISNLGNVRSWRPYGASKEKRTIPVNIKPWISNGYQMVTLSVKQNKKHFSVHSLVAEAFIGPRPDKNVVCHKDDNKINNIVTNIYYGTYSQNGKDAVKNKRLKSGEDSPVAKLSNADVDTIRHLVLSLGMTHKAVAEMFKVSRSTVSGIINSGRRS
jgi:DNA-binding transcriptional regulator YiaG